MRDARAFFLRVFDGTPRLTIETHYYAPAGGEMTRHGQRIAREYYNESAMPRRRRAATPLRSHFTAASFALPLEMPRAPYFQEATIDARFLDCRFKGWRLMGGSSD